MTSLYSLGLAEFVDDKTRAELRLKPCSLRRHDLARISNVHNLLHRDGIESQSSTHLPTIHTALELAKTTQASYEVNTLRAAEITDIQNLIENQTAGDIDIKHSDRIIIVVGTLLSLQAELERELMELLRLVDLGALILNDEVDLQGGEELFRRHTIEILHHTVVIKNRQL